MQGSTDQRSRKRLDEIPFPFSNRFPTPKPKRRTGWILFLLLFCLTGTSGLFYTKLSRLERKHQKARTHLKHLQYEVSNAKAIGHMTLPPKLTQLPFAEDAGIVLSVKPIQIRNIVAPYNPCLLPSPTGYELFFRYDVFNRKAVYAPFYSRIGVVALGPNFEQGNEEFKRITLNSEHVEDPRALKIGDDLYLFCSMLNPEDTRCRYMCVANLDPATFSTNYVTALDINIQWIEKNWCPFEYVGYDGNRHLCIEYQMSPRKLFVLPDPQVNDLKNVILPSGSAYTYLPWVQKWGIIRGGTPAQKIGDEYLSFFHSWFREENGMYWYVMGAYTFQAEAPFTITKMSEYPILFRSIFDSPVIHTADINKRVIFPSGFVVQDNLIHLAVGENDCATKIITMDKEKLLESLMPFDP